MRKAGSWKKYRSQGETGTGSRRKRRLTSQGFVFLSVPANAGNKPRRRLWEQKKLLKGEERGQDRTKN